MCRHRIADPVIALHPERVELACRASPGAADAAQSTPVWTSALSAIPQVDTTAYDRLALIVTRLDSDETTDPLGSYSITLDSQG